MPDHGSYVGPSVVVGEGVQIGRNAVIDGDIELGDGVRIGHGAIVEGQFTIGEGTVIGHHTVICGTGKIGSHNQIGTHCSIGQPPQHFKRPKSIGPVIIGSNNVIREYSTLHEPFETSETRIGDGCYVMAYCNINHDCAVHDNVIMGSHTTLAGVVIVEDFANCGLGVLVHQYSQIGAYCMVAMGSVVLRDVLPFTMLVNQRVQKLNLIGLSRQGVNPVDIQGISALYHRFRPQHLGEDGTWYGKIVSDFCKRSKRGFYYPDADWQDTSRT
jgi:UDP-N-acetylglucosamine acyltransferase